MARFKDESIIVNAFVPQLQPGEQITHYAYGVRQPNVGLILLLVCLAILPGLIATALLTKEYVIALTSNRLIVLEFGGKLNVKRMFDYYPSQLPPVATSKGALFTHIEIKDPNKPFRAKFHRMGLKHNREQSQAIADALERINGRRLAQAQGQAPGQVYAA